MTKQELASKIWAMANKMRTKIKANEYKDYILGFMFYKFLSDKEVDFLRDQGITDDELKNMDDDVLSFVKENLGYAISYQNLFSSLKDQGIHLDAKTMTAALDEFNKNVNPAQKMVFDNIFNTLWNGIAKMGDNSNSRDKAVRDMIDMVNTIPSNKQSGYDVLGYVYEFLIYKFATAAKDDGAFYTPHEVSRLISLIVAEHCKDFKELKVYDPTSGSGSLLRTIGEEASRYIDEADIKYYGQEKITETYHLTRMNLVMKGVPSQNIIVRNGDTLEDDWPYFDENTNYFPLRVNAVVSNPPYSLNWEPSSRATDERFKNYGLAPSGKADYAFLLHCLYHMEPEGIMAIVLPHGVLFRGDAEYEIRKNLCIEHNIETVIGLPANLFFATNIPTIIMVLRKNRKADDILFVDASQNYEKGKNQNTLRECDIRRIFDAVKARKNIKNYAELVPYSKLVENDFNLNITRYVNATAEDDGIDFAAIMNGTVLNTELDNSNNAWAAFPSLKAELFEDLGNGYSSFKDVDAKSVATSNSEVCSFKDAFSKKVDDLKKSIEDRLIRDDYVLSSGDIKDIQEKITEAVFDMADNAGIIDKYDAYQHFISNWQGISVDLDTFASKGGCLEVARGVEPNMVLKKSGKEEIEVQEGFKGTIMPFDLIGEVFFKDEYEKVKDAENKIASLESERSDIYEGLEDDVKAAVGDGEKFKEGELKKYLKGNPDDDLKRALDTFAESKALAKMIKDLETEVLDKIKEKIQVLTRDEIKMLLKIKWIEPICKDILGMTDRIAASLVKTVDELKKKYAGPLSVIDNKIKDSNTALTDMLAGLTGNSIDMAAVDCLRTLL